MRKSKKHIRILQQHYYFTTVDKLGTAFAVVCRVKATQDILNDLCNNSIYAPIAEEVGALADRLKHECGTRFNLSPSTKDCIIPHYVGIWKAHKSTFRLISTANHAPLKPTYIRLTKIFGVLMPQFQTNWDKAFKPLPSECRPFFPIIKNAEEYTTRIAEFNRTPTNHLLQQFRTLMNENYEPELHSFDFDRLYTGIPLEDLEVQMGALLDDLWAAQSHRGISLVQTEDAHASAHILKLTGNACKWVPRREVAGHMRQMAGSTGEYGYLAPCNSLLFDLQGIKDLFRYSIQNTYLQFGGRVFKQIIGIPMGANHCVYVANLYLYQYEVTFFKQLVQIYVRQEIGPAFILALRLLHAFRYVGRYVDDEVNITYSPELFKKFLSNTYIEHGIRGIYPPHLGFTTTTHETNKINDFLNLRLQVIASSTECKVLTGIFRKDHAFLRGSVHPNRMPNFHSLIPDMYKFNVIHSQVVTYNRLCNNHSTFIQAVVVLLGQLQRQEYPMPKVWTKLSTSLQKLPKLYGCTSITMFRRIYAVFHQHQDRLST